MPYWRLFYHLIWATRGREPLIGSDREAEVWKIVRLAGERAGAEMRAVGGVADHVHAVVSIPPSIAVSEVVRRIKGGSSHDINQSMGDFAWQSEYGVVSFAERQLPRVLDYVNNQPTHHATHQLWPILEQLPDPNPNSQPASSRLRQG